MEAIHPQSNRSMSTTTIYEWGTYAGGGSREGWAIEATVVTDAFGLAISHPSGQGISVRTPETARALAESLTAWANRQPASKRIPAAVSEAQRMGMEPHWPVLNDRS